jgi:hypothetical protein
MMDEGEIARDHAALADARALAGAASLIDTEERRRLVITDLCRHARRDAVATLQGCDAVTAALRDKLPEPLFRGGAPFFTGQREECDVWAEFASDGQIAAMLSACLDRIGGTPPLMADRKRLFVALWNGFPPAERKAFRDRVMLSDKSN